MALDVRSFYKTISGNHTRRIGDPRIVVLLIYHVDLWPRREIHIVIRPFEACLKQPISIYCLLRSQFIVRVKIGALTFLPKESLP